ncbi:hypothetical protein SAY87_005280 [Trapa incisa]|uniref:protein-serine/threonine phosphatase n=1 Tax=Trapa incisa TaxID=236973 RepID=A0AAN7KAL4_9MYRT|nr:hypothetical protein SAY87_005280 [Trapa incisa]
MGNGIGKLSVCFSGDGHGGEAAFRRQDVPVVLSNPLDEGLGHSFCYVRPDPARLSSSKVHSEEATTFRTISGASVSANTSTPPSTSLIDLYCYDSIDKPSTFESSTSFSSIPLQPIPRGLINSGPISANLDSIPGSGPLEWGFLSGPIERGFMSGPLDRGIISGPLDIGSSDQLKRSFSHGAFAFRYKSRKGSLLRGIKKAIFKTLARGQNSIVAPIKAVKEPEWVTGLKKPIHNENLTVSSLGSLEDDESMESQNIQWAQGKAGEDRVHVIVSEEHGWVFVGIYDGFNGPDATDSLLSHLYPAIYRELRGLLWDDNKGETMFASDSASSMPPSDRSTPVLKGVDYSSDVDCDLMMNQGRNACLQAFEQESYPCTSGDFGFDGNLRRKRDRSSRSKYRGVAKKWEENQRKWKCEWDRERLELDRRLKEQMNRSGSHDSRWINHTDILKALSRALKKTEEDYLEIADKMVTENPELALMGSCVLAVLMKGEDVYVMNVGDSSAVLAQKAEPDYRIGKGRQDLERIKEETLYDMEASEWDQPSPIPCLRAFQLTVDHSTNVEEEVRRIRKEHPDDASAVMNERVKGSLKVTRAFGAGFLKKPKWNSALLEMFQIDYVGTSPYITCSPSLYHHRLGPRDRFLILSSDGLYQYFTKEEAVSEVELFFQLQPEGDPAQHLIEEVLFRAAKKAGIEFHDLLEIPQGDRRRYHDDISIIIVSLEGRIWRSCV